MHTAGQIARVFGALAAESRVRLVRALRGRTLCVGALSRRLGVTQGAVSQHLRILRDAGLVVGERHGYFVHYRLSEQKLAAWGRLAEELLGPTTADKPEAPCKRAACPERKGAAVCAASRSSARSRRT
jgi:DNA-binding transcriptional ArsR family regulator